MDWLFRILKIILILGCMPAFQGCIHTYPDDNAVDPTLLHLGIEAQINLGWLPLQEAETKSQWSEKGMEGRLIIEMYRDGESVGKAEKYLSEEAFGSGLVRFVLPFPVHALNYDLVAWFDFVDSQTHDPLAYDAAQLRDIKDDVGIEMGWNDGKECRYAHSQVDLRGYKDKWGCKVIVPVKLDSPMGRFCFKTDDLEEFADNYREYIDKREQYTVCIAFKNKIGEDFNAFADKSVNYSDKPEYFYPLEVNKVADGEVVIANGGVFLDEEEGQLTASVIVYNSARMIVSKSPDVTFPLERGKVTTLKGHFLTNYFYNDISVDNIWDGEIM